MKVIYEEESCTYCVVLEYPETEIHVAADSIAEAKSRFIDHISWIFELTIQEQLKD